MSPDKPNKDQLLKMVDHLEQLWLENQALQIVWAASPPVSLFHLKEIFQLHIVDPAIQAHAHQRFAPLRELLQGSPRAEEVLRMVLEALQKIEGLGR